MVDIITRAQTCMNQEYCTDCTLRKDCFMRSTFYDEANYNSLVRDANIFTFASLSEGMNPSNSLLAIRKISQSVDKKRQKELELHPTYLPE